LSTARNIKMTGALMAEPPQCGGRSTTLMLDFAGQFDQSAEAAIHMSGTDLAPYDLNLSGITAVQLVGITILSGGPLVLLLDSTAGTAQAVPVSEEFLLSNRNGPPITRIQIVGTADIEVMLAGH